jgi:hypothetical protein
LIRSGACRFWGTPGDLTVLSTDPVTHAEPTGNPGCVSHAEPPPPSPAPHTVSTTDNLAHAEGPTHPDAGRSKTRPHHIHTTPHRAVSHGQPGSAPVTAHVLVGLVREGLPGGLDSIVQKAVRISDHFGLDEEESQKEFFRHTAQPHETRLGQSGGHGHGRDGQATREQARVLKSELAGQVFEDPEGPVALSDVRLPCPRSSHPGTAPPAGCRWRIPALRRRVRRPRG